MSEQNQQNETQIVQKKPEFGISLDDANRSLRGIRQFQQLVRSLMTPNLDYGVIPGTKKNSLWKPGAEKIIKLLKLADTYEFMDKSVDYEKPFFAYTIKCQLKMYGTEVIISEGIGHCNSYESKYKFRWAYENDIPEGLDKNTLAKKTFTGRGGSAYCKYRIDNDDICSVANTVLKMAKKRAMVDAALSAGRLSEIFTQDINDDDLVEGMDMPPAEPIKMGVAGLQDKINGKGKKKDIPPAEPVDPDFARKQVEQTEALKKGAKKYAHAVPEINPNAKYHCGQCNEDVPAKDDDIEVMMDETTKKLGLFHCACGWPVEEVK